MNTLVKKKCAIKWCKSNLPATEKSNENIGDGCFAIEICKECKELFPFDDLPEPDAVEKILKTRRKIIVKDNETRLQLAKATNNLEDFLFRSVVDGVDEFYKECYNLDRISNIIEVHDINIEFVDTSSSLGDPRNPKERTLYRVKVKLGIKTL